MTEIDAINDIIGAAGESPIDPTDPDYQSHPLYQQALRVLNSVHTREWARGWWFNTSDVSPYDATTILFTAAPAAYAAYVVALAQVRFLKDYDGDEGKIKFYAGEAGLAASSVLAAHLRNVLNGLAGPIASAVSTLIRVAEEATGDPLQQALVLIGANRIERIAAAALEDISSREQAQGWWFNTNTAGAVTPVTLVALPTVFLDWVTALAAIRIAGIFNAGDTKIKQLQAEAHRAATLVLTMHLNSVLAALDSRFAAAVTSLVRVAEEVNGGVDSPLYRSMAMVGTNRVDLVAAKALTEVNLREQSHGWWFNTDADTEVITVLALDHADVPNTFREWITAAAAVRVAQVYGANQVKVQQLQDDAIKARYLFMREHIKESAVNLKYTNAVLDGLTWWNGRYRARG